VSVLRESTGDECPTNPDRTDGSIRVLAKIRQAAQKYVKNDD